MEWKSYIIAFIITAAAAVLTLYSCSTAKMQPQPQKAKEVRTAIQENNKDQSLLHEYFSGVTTAIIEG